MDIEKVWVRGGPRLCEKEKFIGGKLVVVKGLGGRKLVGGWGESCTRRRSGGELVE